MSLLSQLELDDDDENDDDDDDENDDDYDDRDHEGGILTSCQSWGT